MNRRELSGLLSSLISQLLLLLFLLFQPTTISTTQQQQTLFSVIQHFLSISQTAPYISRKRKRTHKPDPAILFNPDTFKHFFNMKPSSFEWLSGLLEPLLDCRDPVQFPLTLSPKTRLGIGLFRLFKGAHFEEIASRFNVSEKEAKFCFKHLCRVLCTNFRFWVGFPGQNELVFVSSRFEEFTGFPNCCGVLSCCRFGDIGVQIVVDSSSRILSIAAGFLGSMSDSEVLDSSNLCKDVEKGVFFGDGSLGSVNVNGVDVPRYFLGSGGGYVLRPWLMVPFEKAETGSVEESFNNVHRFMSVSSLKAVASLRNWGVLSGMVKEERKVAVACIGACAILQNMLIDREDYTAFCEDFDGEEVNGRIGAGLDANMVEGSAIRDALAMKAKKDIVG